MYFMLATTDKTVCETASAGLCESLLSCHLNDIVIRTAATVLRTLMSVWLGESCPQQAGSWIVKMGEETRRSRARVGQREPPRARKESAGEHPRF